MRDFSLKFLTRPGCHLCDEARPIVEAEAGRADVEVVEIDIEGDDGLLGRFGVRIPVVLGPGDVVLAEGRIESGPLRRAIRRIGR